MPTYQEKMSCDDPCHGDPQKLGKRHMHPLQKLEDSSERATRHLRCPWFPVTTWNLDLSNSTYDWRVSPIWPVTTVNPVISSCKVLETSSIPLGHPEPRALVADCSVRHSLLINILAGGSSFR